MFEIPAVANPIESHVVKKLGVQFGDLKCNSSQLIEYKFVFRQAQGQWNSGGQTGEWALVLEQLVSPFPFDSSCGE